MGIDTLSIAQDPRAAALPQDQAAAIAAAIGRAMSEGAATKADLDPLGERVDARSEQEGARVEARFYREAARVDARFAMVDARFAQVDARFDQIEAQREEADVKGDSRLRSGRHRSPPGGGAHDRPDRVGQDPAVDLACRQDLHRHRRADRGTEAVID